MHTAYKFLRRSIEILESKKRFLKKYGCADGRKSISDILDELKSYYKNTILELVRNRINTLHGLGPRIIAFGSKPNSRTSSKSNAKFMRVASLKLRSVRKNKREGKGKADEKTSMADAQVSSRSKKTVGKPPKIEELPKVTLPGPKSISLSLRLKNQEVRNLDPLELCKEQKKAQPKAERTQFHGDFVECVNRKIRSEVLQTLSDILHGISFPQLKYQFDAQRRKKAVQVKAQFEKSIFLAIDFMYRFDLIEKDEMKNFFETPDMLELTGRHLLDLFKWHRNAFSAYHTFFPNLSFILTDWHTDHLHRCLADLGEKAQRRLVYTALKSTFEALDLVKNSRWYRSPDLSSINHYFLQRDFLDQFEEWSPPGIMNAGASNLGLDLLMQEFEKRLKYFQCPLTPLDTYHDFCVNQVDYLMNYHVLHFFKFHGNLEMKRMINNAENYQKFWKQFELIRLGLTVQENIGRYFDYGYFLAYPVEARNTMPSQVSMNGKERVRLQFQQLATAYHVLDKEVEHLMATDGILKAWKQSITVEFILSYLAILARDLEVQAKARNKNMWLLSIKQHVNCEADGYEERQLVLQHLREHFNLPAWYVFLGAFGEKKFWKKTFLNRN